MVAVIALGGAGGVRLISNLVEVEPEQVAIGMPVSTDLALPRFRPVQRR